MVEWPDASHNEFVQKVRNIYAVNDKFLFLNFIYTFHIVNNNEIF